MSDDAELSQLNGSLYICPYISVIDQRYRPGTQLKYFSMGPWHRERDADPSTFFKQNLEPTDGTEIRCDPQLSWDQSDQLD
jgi:hypothetical protein